MRAEDRSHRANLNDLNRVSRETMQELEIVPNALLRLTSRSVVSRETLTRGTHVHVHARAPVAPSSALPVIIPQYRWRASLKWAIPGFGETLGTGHRAGYFIDSLRPKGVTSEGYRYPAGLTSSVVSTCAQFDVSRETSKKRVFSRSSNFARISIRGGTYLSQNLEGCPVSNTTL